MALTVGKAGPASDFRKFMEKRLQSKNKKKYIYIHIKSINITSYML